VLIVGAAVRVDDIARAMFHCLHRGRGDPRKLVPGGA
jgi:hypothetical protein